MKQVPIPNLDSFDIAYPKLLMICSVSWATITQFFSDTFDGDSFFPFFFLLIAIDTITGVWKSMKLHNFDSYKFGGIITKIILYGCFLGVVFVLTEFSKNESIANFFKEWASQGAYAIIVVREAISIIENIGVINPKLLPTWILKRLRQFDENGQPIPPSE